MVADSTSAFNEGDAEAVVIKIKAGQLTRPSKGILEIKDGDTQSKIHQYLSQQADWSARLLLDLVNSSATYDRLNPAVLNAAEGLAFINVGKGGFGLTLGGGYGFVIRKIHQDMYGNSEWSQPLFFVVSQAGLGISAGYQRCQSVIALLSASAMDVFVKGTRSLGSDLGLFSTDGALCGMSGGAVLGSSTHMGMAVDAHKTAFCYSKVDGAYLELSMHGSAITPDKASNEQMYGPHYQPEDILNKGGAYLPALHPVLKVIVSLGKKALTGSA